MTIFAGMLARGVSGVVPLSARHALRSLVSRNGNDHIEEIERPELHLVKFDLGVLSGSGLLRDTDGSIAMLAGDPLYAPEGEERTAGRERDLVQLHAGWGRRDWLALRHCTGTFCAAMYNPVERSLTLISDRLGARPIYYWIGPDYVVFSTALRILEGMAEVPRRMDLRGVSEIACFGVPLADRTAYADVRTIREAEVIEVGPTEVRKTCYWRWDQLPQNDMDSDELADLVYRRFVRAVQRRLGDDRTVAAFLSGGLDSRAVVAVLRKLDVSVHTINWAAPGSQDRVFGSQIAKVLGSTHWETPSIIESEVEPLSKVREWLRSELVQSRPPDRSGVVWSGGGGSVGVGHVYLNRSAVDEFRSGRVRESVEEFLRYNSFGLPKRMFVKDLAVRLGHFPHEGMEAELTRLECQDPGRSLHLFLMFNDQRRHTAEHLENIDIDRIEFLEPFYDSHFLEPILSAEVGGFLGHAFYMEWLKRFPPAATAVAWQTYPNHMQCPIAAHAGLDYQWNKEIGGISWEQRISAFRWVLRLVLTRDFPSAVFDRGRLLAAGAATALGVGDYSYLQQVANIFWRYWGACGGTYADD
jgi:asparagine synthase (glutamine-hydrolysing)